MILPTNRFVVQFLSRITENEDGCWIWTGLIDKTGGYPRWYAGDTEDRWAHRLAYKLAGGEIPDGWHVDHLCRVRCCVRPSRLEAVPPIENARRAAVHIPFVHGFKGYYRGCRCQICRKGEREYAKSNVDQARQDFAAGLIEQPHGDVNTYRRYGCRCDDCRQAIAANQMAYRRANGVRPRRVAQHGTTSRYTAHKCRCDECRQAWSDYWKAYRASKAAS